MYDNYDSIIGSFLNICCFIKPLANKSAFCKYLERDNSKFSLPNFFINNTTLLVKKVVLAKYISGLQGH